MRGGHAMSIAGARLAVAAIAAGLALAPALARDLTGLEHDALVRALDGFTAAMAAVDGPAVADTLPPRMVAWLAAQAGIDSRAERRSTADQLDAAKAAGLRMTMGYDLAAADVASLDDGTPYVVVPMRGVEESPVHRDIQAKALALMEGGRWYFLSLGTPARMERLRKAYPEFAGVAFDDATPSVKP